MSWRELAAQGPARYDGRMTAARRARLYGLVLATLAVAASLAVIAAYLARASALVAYPWDWSPDEGLYLDHARRLAEMPAALRARTFVPFPSAYGPVLLLLLAPVAGAAGALSQARLVALGWTLAGSIAVYLLVRRKAPRPLALAACALALVPFDVTFWHMLVRPDGPMLALLLLAALPLLPAAVAPGADRLTPARLWSGTALALLAVLTKATAAVHAAPLVLAWLLVDRRAGVRLVLTLATTGLLILAFLQWLTGGGFLWVNSVWRYHPSSAGLPAVVLADFLGLAWPLVLLYALSLWLAADRRALLRDGSSLLLLGAVLVLPLTTKTGASWNYLVPLVPAIAVAVARGWAQPGTLGGLERPTLGAALVASAALALALWRPFPLPSAEDRRTADLFYGYVADVARAGAGPILAMRPEYAYFHVGQPVEMEGSCFVYLARGHAPGSETIEAKLAEGVYSLVIWTWPLPDTGSYRASADRLYVPAGGCKLGYYFGAVTATLLPRRDLYRPMLPRAGTRCGSLGLPAAP
jgi:4-amino-4-deoxy-L-arabinose transferase-like glycosyltransferase